MTKDQLPERLRNIAGLEMVTGERIKITLSETKINKFAEVFLPELEKDEKQKGA